MDEDAVALGQDVLHGALEVLNGRVLQDDVHDVGLERLALLFGQGQPFLLR